MENKIYLSLCIPTNGVIEWVLPVLESIYSGNCNLDVFQVVVTDNGNNSEFEKLMLEYRRQHDNFVYKKTDSVLFQNQIEAFKLANGQLIKFINHRMTLLPGAVDYLINFVEKYRDSKPPIYFSNGALKLKPKIKKCLSFDEYVKTLSYWSSWSAGTAIWKSDFEKMNLNNPFNKMFPHTDIVFFKDISDEFIIDDTPLLSENTIHNTKKGKYDLFDAFAVQYPRIIQQLFVSQKIGFENEINVFYSKKEIQLKALLFCFKKVIDKILKIGELV